MADAFDDVYFASCTPCGGIYRYRMYEDGSLCFADKISCDRPMYMTADGDVLHVLLRQPFTDIDESGLISYDIHSDGSLTERLPAVTTGGNVICAYLKKISMPHIMFQDRFFLPAEEPYGFPAAAYIRSGKTRLIRI